MVLLTGKRADTLLVLMHLIERFTLVRAWEGLTDDEFFWEPVGSAWSIRQRHDCRTASPFGSGEWVADFEFPEPTPVPMTTIAWLYWHMGSMPGRLCDIDFLGGTRTMGSGWASPYLAHHPIFTSAGEAVAALRDGWERLRVTIEQADDEQLEVSTAQYTYAAEPMRDGLCVVGVPGPQVPASFFVAGTLTEVDHHGAQICALRDLYASDQSG
ncbi:MAG: DinB family protein [Acidimicrobiales bacterium]